MKRLMITAAAALAGTVAFADIQSQNVVGYHTASNKDGATQQVMGSSFVNTSKDTIYKLSDFSISLGVTPTATKRKRNYISFIKPGAAAFDATKQFWYDSSVTPGVWKYKFTSGDVVKDTDVPDFEIPQNTGFLFSVNASDKATLNFAGQVVAGSDGKVDVSAPSGVTQVMVVNPACREISLADLTISGPSSATKRKRNYISFIKPGAAAFDATKQYWYDSSATPGVWKYKFTSGDVVKDTAVANPENVKIAMGEGFLFSVNSSDGAVLHFPDALTSASK